MRLIMMGTGPFAVPTFRGLCETPHSLVALVTRPPHGRLGRGPASVGPMREIAEALGMPIFDPEDVNAEASRAELNRCNADLLVVCDYGQILSDQTLATTRLGGINIHGSLLPKYRGAAPVNWAVYHGERETGVSVIHMTPKLDAGPVIAQDRTPIDPNETAEQLEARLARIGAGLVPGTIDALASGHVQSIDQDVSQISKAPRLKKSDGLIDWNRPAIAIKNHIRAMQPWPGAFTFWHRPGGEPLRLIVGPVTVIENPDPAVSPGTVVENLGDRLVVAAGEGAVVLHHVQPAGKRMLAAAEFLRGYQVEPGQRLGPQ